jgi:hypothetical protein
MQKWFSDEHRAKYEKGYGHRRPRRLAIALIVIGLAIVGYAIYLALH